MTNKVIDFGPFKNSKKWEDDYCKNFISYINIYFKDDKMNAEKLCKMMYYLLRYLEGIANNYMIFRLAGCDIGEFEKGRKYLIEWLEYILEKLKQ